MSLSRGAKVNADIVSLLKARHTLLWITSREEKRVESALIEAAAACGFKIVFWDCIRGRCLENGKSADDRQTSDPIEMLKYAADARPERDRTIYVMRDLHAWKDPPTLRALRNLARQFQTERKHIVVLTPSSELPIELSGHATVIDYPLPDRAEVAAILDDVLTATGKTVENRDACIDAAMGLSAEEIANCYSKSLVTTKTILPSVVVNEKKRVIAKEKVLTWYDPDPRGLDAIGGLEPLKAWLLQRRLAFSPAAKAYGLPSPKGLMLVGVSGCGKSLTAKCVATAFGMPLLRLDFGGLRSKYVGESETNFRKALAVAEAAAPCIILVDEIEKALAGASGAGDGGVAADALGTFLSWMQDRTAPVFVIATANDVSALPPELLRKGRFDELFFVDLPTVAERAEVLRATLTDFGSRSVAWPDGGPIDVPSVATATAGFTGSEIAALVPDAMFAAFADGERRVTTADLLKAAGSVIPLSKTASEKIEKLREWASTRCRMASAKEETAEAPRGGRRLDLDDN